MSGEKFDFYVKVNQSASHYRNGLDSGGLTGATLQPQLHFPAPFARCDGLWFQARQA
ncbi:uncharacterized protein YecE (DUF72 family) [Rhizobium herbae]|uniref:Uncharacterized protein YecE (DUF72 family) n=1 Tax=Rhizobium herbae TaxID=508661 RepID=A0ABS4EF51_9HYPH|nr:uncharacterized protein YecE (DUF72 family) [Rhizobium herbae]